MSLKLYFVGKSKKKFIVNGIKEYQKRIRKYLPFKIEIIPEEKCSKNQKKFETIEVEASRILKKIKSNTYLIVLDERGRQFTSVEFAGFLEKKLSQKNVAFLVGGVYGLSKRVKDRADLILGFSKFTFTHQMIRIILLEQLYRALTIQKNKAYHY